LDDDARASAPVIAGSTELTVTEAADTLSREFQSEAGPVETRSPIAEEKKVDPPALSDDTKVTLKDGAELSLRELKRGYISRKTFTAKTQALADERARFEEFRAHTQHHSTQVQALRQALETVAAVLLPQQPDRSLIDVDPQAYKTQLENFEFIMGLIAEAQQTVQAEFNAAQAARDAEQRDLAHRQLMARRQQQEKLLEAMPELANESESRRFTEDAINTMAEYGFSVEEVDAALNDLRNFRVVSDLSRYRRAVKAVPGVKGKVASAPVLTGKRRMDRAAKSLRAERTEFEQFRNSGRLDDAAAILAKRMR
jgi:hypothetical protein